MDIKKLAPWNWFKKEDEEASEKLSVQHIDPRKWGLSSYHPIHEIHQEIDRLFDSAFRGFGFPGFGSTRTVEPHGLDTVLRPILDVASTDKEYTISVEVPGVDENDIRLELVENTLTVRGEKKRETEDEAKNYYRLERSYGSFQRVLSLPDDADQEAIQAKFKKGVLTISIPRKKLPEPNVRRIEVNK